MLFSFLIAPLYFVLLNMFFFQDLCQSFHWCRIKYPSYIKVHNPECKVWITLFLTFSIFSLSVFIFSEFNGLGHLWASVAILSPCNQRRQVLKHIWCLDIFHFNRRRIGKWNDDLINPSQFHVQCQNSSKCILVQSPLSPHLHSHLMCFWTLILGLIFLICLPMLCKIRCTSLIEFPPPAAAGANIDAKVKDAQKYHVFDAFFTTLSHTIIPPFTDNIFCIEGVTDLALPPPLYGQNSQSSIWWTKR